MFKSISIIGCAFLISACGGDSEFGHVVRVINAPDSLKNKSITHVIQNGNGLFASRGKFVTTFSSTLNTYSTIGDGTNIANSAGNYTYSSNENVGTLRIIDSIISTGATCKYTFISNGLGSYLCTDTSNSKFTQNGSFTIL